MQTLFRAFTTSTGKKYLMALTGLALVGFVITHLLGNLLLLVPDPAVFNAYAYSLEKLGVVLIVAELGLLAAFITHVVFALWTRKENYAARPHGYQNRQSKGGPSKSNLSSRTMIVTGLFLLVFIIIHVKQMKFGPGMDQGYMVESNGHESRDLYRLVVEVFSNPAWVAFYVVSVTLLGFHLRHGFWSAFQSLGIAFPKYTKTISSLGVLIAIGLAVGFLVIPIYLYMFVAPMN